MHDLSLLGHSLAYTEMEPPKSNSPWPPDIEIGWEGENFPSMTIKLSVQKNDSWSISKALASICQHVLTTIHREFQSTDVDRVEIIDLVFSGPVCW